MMVVVMGMGADGDDADDGWMKINLKKKYRVLVYTGQSS